MRDIDLDPESLYYGTEDRSPVSIQEWIHGVAEMLERLDDPEYLATFEETRLDMLDRARLLLGEVSEEVKDGLQELLRELSDWRAIHGDTYQARNRKFRECMPS